MDFGDGFFVIGDVFDHIHCEDDVVGIGGEIVFGDVFFDDV